MAKFSPFYVNQSRGLLSKPLKLLGIEMPEFTGKSPVGTTRLTCLNTSIISYKPSYNHCPRTVPGVPNKLSHARGFLHFNNPCSLLSQARSAACIVKATPNNRLLAVFGIIGFLPVKTPEGKSLRGFLFWCAWQGAVTWRCKSSTGPAGGTVSRTARVSIARWNLKEAAGKALA